MRPPLRAAAAAAVLSALTLLGAAALPAPAAAADWLSLNSTELGRKPGPVTPFGFVQPAAFLHSGDAVSGLRGEALSPYNGEVPAFNAAPGGSTWGVQLQRARFGLRGQIPQSHDKINYFMMIELAPNGITRASPVAPTDVSLTFTHLPGAKLRVGQFKLPTMEEIVPSAVVELEFIQFSQTLVKLLAENKVTDGALVGGSFGFRDVGLMLFDGFQKDHLAGSYALMVSNGSGINRVDADRYKDLTGRVELAWVTDGTREDPDREEIKVGAWHLQGQRELPGAEAGDDPRAVERVRQGAFLRVEQGVAWGMVEAARGRGMLEIGQTPPFPGSPYVVVEDGEGRGLVGQAGLRVDLDKLGADDLTVGLKARYEDYRQQTEDPEKLRVFRTTTLGLELDPGRFVRVELNTELRSVEAPQADADTRKLLGSLGPRHGAQVTARF